MGVLMEIGTKKWHESLPDFITELGSLGGMLAICLLLVIAFAIEHHLHPR
jgi:hypothetical protein